MATRTHRSTKAKASKAKAKNYALDDRTAGKRIAAPDLPYEPPTPKRYRPKIGLIGCGGITATHLSAYRKAKFDVVALCDVRESAAQERRAEFYPDADVYNDHRELLARDDIDVVDVNPHPRERGPLIEASLRAGKHVLSQKPFVLDLAYGRKLVNLARRKGLKLAVNQNGRWAPHFSYLRHAVAAGVIGEVTGVRCGVQWDHSWVKGTSFEKIRHLILYDFAIHWFDILNCLMSGHKARRVFASVTRTPTQDIRPGLLAQAVVEYPRAQASLTFDAHTRYGRADRTCVIGTEGTLISTGPSLGDQTVTLHTAAGEAQPKLTGAWFPDGFRGTMGELLCAIEEDREPSNSARHNLDSLALCFAAMHSADEGRPVAPREATEMRTT